ncbi:MAG: HD domain-containing protein [archaeon]
MFHHYVGKKLSRSEKIEKLVLEEILNPKIPEAERENSVAWELKHSSGMIQIAKLLAIKRSLDAEKAIVAAALHDISAIQTGKYEKHAVRGAELAKEILQNNGFSKKEIKDICDAIALHSEKEKYSKNKLAELLKDADLLDCLLYDTNIYSEKPKNIQQAIKKRFRKVCKELGLRCFI